MKKEFLEILIRECVSEVLKTVRCNEADEYDIEDEPETDSARQGTSVINKTTGKRTTWRGRRHRGDAEDWIKSKTSGVNEDTVGAPAPPANDQGTAQTPGVPKDQEQDPTVSLMNTARGSFFVDPRKTTQAGYKGDPLKTLAGKDQAQLERELYRVASRVAGPRVKISNAVLREVPQVLAGKIPAVFLYVGKQDPEDVDAEIYLLPARTLEQAKQGSVPSGTTADHPETAIASDDPTVQQQAQAQAQGGKTLAPSIDEGNPLRELIASMVREALQKNRK